MPVHSCQKISASVVQEVEATCAALENDEIFSACNRVSFSVRRDYHCY